MFFQKKNLSPWTKAISGLVSGTTVAVLFLAAKHIHQHSTIL
jgi:hypothetical protein